MHPYNHLQPVPSRNNVIVGLVTMRYCVNTHTVVKDVPSFYFDDGTLAELREDNGVA